MECQRRGGQSIDPHRIRETTGVVVKSPNSFAFGRAGLGAIDHGNIQASVGAEVHLRDLTINARTTGAENTRPGIPERGQSEVTAHVRIDLLCATFWRRQYAKHHKS